MTDEPLVHGGIAAAMRSQAQEPKLESWGSPEQRLAMLEPRRPQGPAGSWNMDICQWCHNPFSFQMRRSGKPRDSIEYEPLRRVLFITDPNYEPVICDGCYDYVLNAPLKPDKVNTPGWSNSSPPNLLLSSGA